MENLKILVVEDNDTKFKHIHDSLKNIGISEITREKYRNTALLQVFGSTVEKPDFIILDMFFPRYEGGHIERGCGMDILKRMHQRRCEIPVIVCSSCMQDIPEEYSNVRQVILYAQDMDLSRFFKVCLS